VIRSRFHILSVGFYRLFSRTGMVICTFSAPSVKDAIWHYRSCHIPRWRWHSDTMRSQNLAKAFGIVLRKHRKAKKFSQELLAQKADVAVKMVSLIERFERNPTVNLADSLAQGLGVPLWKLIREAEEVLKKHTPKRS
jgi:ribosome-binding protein aMBF1 (putative translation factor)